MVIDTVHALIWCAAFIYSTIFEVIISCVVWDSVMGSPFSKFSFTISNPVSMQELGTCGRPGKLLCRVPSGVRLHGLHAVLF